jgi:phenylpropionate dioxygenase-like ring-hydroxylating dioxygenase large terminal subunit
MTLDLREVSSLVDIERGVVHRRIFTDPDIYQMEMEQIFARAWLFMCHESQIPNPGDFFLNFMGEDRVICVRNNEGGVSVLVNSCRHRGNAVCRADEGHATSFMCTYHGWTYDLKGNLVGVPGFKEVYHEELDRQNWGLIKAPQVDSYKGFVFATMDPEAPTLNEYLNDAGRYPLDLLADQGDMVAVGGMEKYTMNANWKFPTDNTADFYHGLTHLSAGMSGWNGQRTNRLLGRRRPGDNGKQRAGYSVLGEYGHVAGMSYLPDNWREIAEGDPAEHWRFEPRVIERMGQLKMSTSSCVANIFPNIIVFPLSVRQIGIRMPKGPTRCEIWYFTFINRSASEEIQREQLFRSSHTFGASGFLEQDDGENWDQSTRGARGVVTARYPLNYQMGLGHGEFTEDENGPKRIDQGQINEHYMLWQHRAWAEFMAATNWAELKKTHSRPEGTV